MRELIDNRARRIATQKEIIQRAHNGEAPDAVKSQLREMVRQTNPSEIVAMEQELISGGMPRRRGPIHVQLHSHVSRESCTTSGQPDCSRPLPAFGAGEEMISRAEIPRNTTRSDHVETKVGT